MKGFDETMQKMQKSLRLVESALLLAVATVLSLVKLLEMPYGGSVTACSALPLLLISYRHGVGWGLFSGLVFSLLQLFLGMSSLSYCTTAASVVAVILLDYVVAFAVYGLGGLFRQKGRTQGRALVLGSLLAQGLRYLCHVLSGCTVWAGLSIPTNAAFLYSLGYNGTYMVPELVVTVLGAWYFSRVLDVNGQQPARAVTSAAGNGKALVAGLLRSLVLVVTGVVNLLWIAYRLQSPEDGSFTFAGLAQVNWLAVALVTAGGGLVAGGLELWRRRAARG